jgi:hypothetical protein
VRRLLAVAALLALPRVAFADESTFGLSFAIARDGKDRVVDDPWVRNQIDDANRLFVPLGVRFRWKYEKDLPEPHGELHSRKDRDALAALGERGVIDVFVVRELEDVDTPGINRMGVCWQGPGRRFVIVARSAVATVLAHELGHFFGNHQHSTVKNNLMSYGRDGSKVFLDEQQSATIKSLAATYLANGTLVDIGPPRLLP